MIAVWGYFCSPEGVINGFCGNYGSLLVWDGPFLAGGTCGLCLGLGIRRVRVSPSGIGLFWLGGGWGGGVLMGSVDSRELGVRASTSRFILLVRFSDTLLLVSILDMVYDCHLRPLLQS